MKLTYTVDQDLTFDVIGNHGRLTTARVRRAVPGKSSCMIECEPADMRELANRLRVLASDLTAYAAVLHLRTAPADCNCHYCTMTRADDETPVRMDAERFQAMTADWPVFLAARR